VSGSPVAAALRLLGSREGRSIPLSLRSDPSAVAAVRTQPDDTREASQAAPTGRRKRIWAVRSSGDRIARGAILTSMGRMDFEFEAPVIEWRGPAPFYFARVPEEESAEIKLAARGLEYWGQVPVVVRVSDIEFGTALFPKNGRYLIPLKDEVRKSAGIEIDQVLAVGLNVGRE